jgi:hypothetical protein
VPGRNLELLSTDAVCFPQEIEPVESRMTDDLTKKGAPDRSRISLSEEWEVQYWTKELGVTRRALEHAVARVGNSPEAVRRELFGR